MCDPPPQVPSAADNFLSFSGVLEPLPRPQPSSAAGDVPAVGAVTVHFGRGIGAVDDDCSGVRWPVLDSLRVLGVHHKVRSTAR